MKTKFKKGDKVIVTAKKDGHNFKIGQTVIIEDADIEGNSYGCYDLGKKNHWYLSDYEFKRVSNHPLIITKQTKVRAGKKYYTWQMSKNKKVVNHQFNQSGTRNKQLNQFIEDIKSGNYEIK